MQVTNRWHSAELNSLRSVSSQPFWLACTFLYAFSHTDLLVYRHTFSHRQEVMLVPVTWETETVAKIRWHWDLILSFLSIPSSHTRRIHSKIEALLSRSDGCSSLSLPSRSRQQLNNWAKCPCFYFFICFFSFFFLLSHFLVCACSYLKPAQFKWHSLGYTDCLHLSQFDVCWCTFSGSLLSK